MIEQAINIGLNNLENTAEALDQPNWPKSRGLHRYKQLVTIAPELLPTKSAWLDIGPGESAQALKDLQRTDVKKMAISAHKVDFPDGIEAHFGYFPSQKFNPTTLGQMDLITDIYSAFSYSDDPIFVLAQEVSLLKVGGKLAIFSERYKLKSDELWFRLIDIIEPLMGVDLSFKSKEIFADANQKKETGLEIIIEKKHQTSVESERLLEIFYEVVGRPQIVDTIWSPNDSQFKINSIDYC